MSIAQYLRNTAQMFPDKTVVFYDNEAITYQQLDQEVDNIAQGLSDLGLKRGDKAAIILGNSSNFVRSYFAILRVGAIIVPLNPGYKEDELVYILNDANVKCVITNQESLPIIEKVQAEIHGLTTIVAGGIEIENFISFEELLHKEGGAVDLDIDVNDTAACLYTSGTSGRPKGALLSHSNFIFLSEATIKRMNMKQQDNTLCVLPLSHIFSQICNMLMPIFLGGNVTILPRFVPSEVLKEISIKNISLFSAVPAMYAALLNVLSQNQDFDISSLRVCISGGAPLPTEITKGFMEKYGIPLVEGMGSTEASSCINSPEANKPGSVGRPFEGVKLKVIDENDRELPQGEIGELCIQGPSVMQGYLNLPEATAVALKGGWFHTGDLARIDEDGYVYILGRKKDMLLVGGLNVYPSEVEQCLSSHPNVLEVAVIGTPDKDRGEVPKAFIVLKPGAEGDFKELILYCRKHLANYKCPREVVFVESLPKNPTGKVDKMQLK